MINDLLARLEAATGADRELDWLIAEALGEVPEHVIQGPVGMPYGWFRREGEWSLIRTKESDVYAGVESWSPKPRTASIDAALTLCPEQRGPWSAWNWAVQHMQGGFTPALAICIASLRASAGEG